MKRVLFGSCDKGDLKRFEASKVFSSDLSSLVSTSMALGSGLSSLPKLAISIEASVFLASQLLHQSHHINHMMMTLKISPDLSSGLHFLPLLIFRLARIFIVGVQHLVNTATDNKRREQIQLSMTTMSASMATPSTS